MLNDAIEIAFLYCVRSLLIRTIKATETERISGMKISIITPICNEAAGADSCIQSVVNQTYPDIEFIVVDHGLSEEKKHKVKRELRNAHYYQVDDNTNGCNAINFGIRKSTGDILCILSPNDQLYDKHCVQKVVDSFVTSKANIVYGKGELKRGAGILRDLRKFGSKPYLQKQLPFGKIPLHTSIYVTRKLLWELGYANENYAVNSEYELFLRLFMQQNAETHFLDDFVLKVSLQGQEDQETQKKHPKRKKVREYNRIPIKNIAMS